MPVTVQHRTYTIRQGLLDEWAERWRSQIVPLRLEFGFEIRGAWLDHERSQFIWVIAYDGPESFEERNQHYWASPRRAEMDLDPTHYLVGRVVREVSVVY
ncbi:NIPSNAP family protein [Streptosporangium saharense]|uniref:NIPSNAP family protein n=1 Tax=Streptosporangium saharense TaxID=1706840 RepID=UPI00342AEAA8